MIIKVNRKELDIKVGDIFLDNASVIMLMTQKISRAGHWPRQISPTIPKKVWKELQNTLNFTKSKYGEYEHMFLYKVIGVKND